MDCGTPGMLCPSWSQSTPEVVWDTLSPAVPTVPWCPLQGSVEGTEQDQAHPGLPDLPQQQTGLGDTARTSSSHQGLPGSTLTQSHRVSVRDGRGGAGCPQDGRRGGRSRLGWAATAARGSSSILRTSRSCCSSKWGEEPDPASVPSSLRGACLPTLHWDHPGLDPAAQGGSCTRAFSRP